MLEIRVKQVDTSGVKDEDNMVIIIFHIID